MRLEWTEGSQACATNLDMCLFLPELFAGCLEGLGRISGKGRRFLLVSICGLAGAVLFLSVLGSGMVLLLGFVVLIVVLTFHCRVLRVRPSRYILSHFEEFKYSCYVFPILSSS